MNEELKAALQVIREHIWQENPNLRSYISDPETIEVIKATMEIAGRIHNVAYAGRHYHEIEARTYVQEPITISFHTNLHHFNSSFRDKHDITNGTLTIQCSDASF